MSDELDDAKLSELTKARTSIAVAKCIEGLGCSVFVNGEEVMEPWKIDEVQELLGCHPRDGAILTTHAKPECYMLRTNHEADAFQLIQGPLSPEELLDELNRAENTRS